MIRRLYIHFISYNYAHSLFMAMMKIIFIVTLLFLPQWPSISPYLPPQPDSSPGVTLRQIEIFNLIFHNRVASRLVSFFSLFLTSTLSTQIPHGLLVYLFYRCLFDCCICLSVFICLLVSNLNSLNADPPRAACLFVCCIVLLW